MGKAIHRVLLLVMRFHQWTYIRTNGRLGSSPAGRTMLLLRTIGQRTGLPRTTALFYVLEGDRYGVIASNGGARRNPGWFHNLMSSTDAEIQIGRTRIPIHARPATDDERTRIWTQADSRMFHFYRGYQKRTIPVLVLEPR